MSKKNIYFLSIKKFPKRALIKITLKDNEIKEKFLFLHYILILQYNT